MHSGSHFPVDRVWSTYTRLLDALDSITPGVSPSYRLELFHDNAVRIYRI
jgi:predicted TIM-barrel fold metal-dependent hydrolase